MTDEQLKVMQAEYHASRDMKQRFLHSCWARVAREYQFDSTWDLFHAVENYLNVSIDQAILDHHGRLPSLNIIVRKLVAMLSLNIPEFSIENLNPSDEAIAWVLEQHLRGLLGQIDFRGTEKQLVLDAALCGTVVAKVGYSGEYVYGEEAWSDSVPRNANQKDAQDVKQWPYGPDTEYEMSGRWQAGRPSVTPVRPHDIFPNPGARVLKEVRRIYHRNTRYLSDVYHDSRYDRQARARCKGQYDVNRDELKSTYPNSLSDELEREVQRLDVIECFDLPSQQYAVFVEDVDEPLRDWTPLPWKKVRCPYKFWTPIPNPESLWGIPYALLLLRPVEAANIARQAALRSMESEGKRVRFWRGGSGITQDVVDERIATASDGANLVMEEWTDGPFEELMYEHDFGGANPEVFQMESIFSSDVAYVSGLDDPTRNRYKDDAPTATEVSIRQSQQTVSIDDIRDSYEQFLEHIMTDVCQISLAEWGEEQMVKVVGTDPRVYFWTPVERQRIQGDFWLKVHAGTTVPQDKTVYRRQITELVPRIVEMKNLIDQEDMMVKSGQMNPSPVDLTALLREVLDAYDPRIADRVLNQKDPAEIVMRLVGQHHFSPTRITVSQRLQQMLRGRATAAPGTQQGAQGGPGTPQGAGQPNAPFEARTGTPAPGNPQFGRFPMDQTSGRPLSELQGGGRTS